MDTGVELKLRVVENVNEIKVLILDYRPCGVSLRGRITFDIETELPVLYAESSLGWERCGIESEVVG